MLAKSYHNSEFDEKEVFLEIYKAYYQDLFRYGYKLSGDKEMTKDCIQEMFFELWGKENRFAAVIKLKPYLIKYLQRKIFKEASKKRSQNGAFLNDNKLVASEEPYETLLIRNQQSADLHHALESAIKCLTKRQIQIVELRFMKGLSFDEIGEMLGLQHRTMYNQLQSAIKVLKEKLRFSTPFSVVFFSFIF